MINLNDIKPAVKNESDKYSWNLYRFLKKVTYCNAVIVDIEGWQRDKGEPFDIKRIKEAGYLGVENVFIVRANGTESGRRLRSIVNETPPFYQTAYHYWLTGDRIQDITEVFWAEYKRRGRCLFWNHEFNSMRGREHRYIKINKHSRKCAWCGHVQTRRIETVKTIKRVECWE